MKAAQLAAYGQVEGVRLEDAPEPAVASGDVLVDVRAAGVNWADWSITRGEPYLVRLASGLARPRVPIRGTDVAGTVAAVGADVRTFEVGDEVFGWCTAAFAERVSTPQATLIPKPSTLSMEEAAAAPMAGMVALQAIRDIGDVQRGDRVLVVGASGGIGTFAVQIAKLFGAEVTGVCSTRNIDLVRSVGADHVIDYTEEDFTRSGEKFDVILDMVDTHSIGARRSVLETDGVLIPNSGRGGRWIASLGRIVGARMLSPFVSQTLRPFLSMPDLEDLRTLAAMMASGDVVTVVDRTFLLADAAAAIEYVGAGHTRGKTVIVV